MNISAAFFVLVLTISSLCNGADKLPVRNCSIFVRCSFVEDIVWASDGQTCFPFINPCHLGTENCNRRANNLTELSVIDKEKCQKMCSSICPDNYLPICGVYNGVKREFPNQCEMDSEICTTGTFYQLHRSGPCE